MGCLLTQRQLKQQPTAVSQNCPSFLAYLGPCMGDVKMIRLHLTAICFATINTKV